MCTLYLCVIYICVYSIYSIHLRLLYKKQEYIKKFSWSPPVKWSTLLVIDKPRAATFATVMLIYTPYLHIIYLVLYYCAKYNSLCSSNSSTQRSYCSHNTKPTHYDGNRWSTYWMWSQFLFFSHQPYKPRVVIIE
jgi:hypothetical protein